MIFNEFYNASSELLAVFLFIHKEGSSNEVFWVEDGRGWWLCIGLISVGASKFGLIHGGPIFERANMERTLPSRHASAHIGIIRSGWTQQRTIDDGVRF
jgi:hypothetical protein